MKIIDSTVYWQNIYHIQHVFMADSCLPASAHSALGAADIAATRKEAKYSCLPPSYSQWRDTEQGALSWGVV